MDDDRGLRVAASQFPVTNDIAANQQWIARHLTEASERGADLLLTSEAALSGYAGSDFENWEGFDWAALRSATSSLAHRARTLGIHLVLGSSHWLADELHPTNCLYVFDRSGALVDRYDKCQLTETDKALFTAGRHKVICELGGVRLGFLICYDICYPEMYAWYREDSVELMLHAFHNAGFPQVSVDDDDGDGPPYLILDEVKPAWMRVRAADNRMWIVAANSSREHSCWGNKVIRPDGSVAEELAAGVPGLLLHPFPDDGRKGWEHNFTPLRLSAETEYGQGETTDHPRYLDRQSPP